MFTFALITLLLTHFNFSTWEVVLLIKKIKQRLKLDLSKSQFSSSFGPAKCLSNRGIARSHKSLAPRGYRDKSLQIRNRISSQIHPMLTFWHYWNYEHPPRAASQHHAALYFTIDFKGHGPNTNYFCPITYDISRTSTGQKASSLFIASFDTSLFFSYN